MIAVASAGGSDHGTVQYVGNIYKYYLAYRLTLIKEQTGEKTG